MRTYAGPLLGRGEQRPVPPQPGQGTDRAVGRVRPADPDRLRPRPRAGPRRGGPGRRTGGAPRRRPHALPRPRPGRREHVDDDQRAGDVAARPLRDGGRRSRGRRGRRCSRHDPERHRQGVPVPRHVHLPARPVAAADHRHDRVDGHQLSEVESGQHLLVPPAGGRGDPGAGGRLRAGDRGGRARRGPRLGPGPARADGRRGGPHLLLRQRGRALRRGDVQDARVRRAVGRADRAAVRGDVGVGPPVPLRRAGQLARPDRGAAGEQRAAHRAGDARRDAVPRRPGPGGPAAGLERGARPAPAVGPAVVAADPAGAGVRVGPAGVPGPVRGVHCGRSG